MHKNFNNMNEKVAICLIAKNEARYLAEWIEYHLYIGVDHIFIYENNSEDDILSICRLYADFVTVYPWALTLDQQRQAYVHFVRHNASLFDWCAFIDADEFIVYKGEGTLKSYLSKHSQTNSLLMPWRLFGTNGHISRPAGLVIENYTKTHAVSPNPYWKTIGRPSRIDADKIESPHDFPYHQEGPVVAAGKCEIVLYHYILRSVEDIVSKITRGDVWSKEAGEKRLRNVQVSLQNI